MFMRAVHPGEVLKGELEELEITPTEFARQIDVPPNRVSQIIAGKRSVTGDTALRFGHWFRQRSSVLAQPSGPIRPGSGRQGDRRRDPSSSDEGRHSGKGSRSGDRMTIGGAGMRLGGSRPALRIERSRLQTARRVSKRL